jgi:hypothetical protein
MEAVSVRAIQKCVMRKMVVTNCSESFSALRFFTEDADPSASTTAKLICKLDLTNNAFKNGSWMEVAQDRVQ